MRTRELTEPDIRKMAQYLHLARAIHLLQHGGELLRASLGGLHHRLGLLVGLAAHADRGGHPIAGLAFFGVSLW
jgi:hypothetical protein